MANEKTFLAKLGNSFLALIGANSPDEFGSRFESAWTALTGDVATLKAQKPADLSAFEARILAIENAHTETANSLTTLSTTVSSIKPDALIAQAKEAGILGATEVLGKTGNSAPVGSAPNNEQSKDNSTETLVAAGKYEDAWKADTKLQEQFVSASTYAHYMKAASAGRVFAKATV